jgi:pyrroline-5-carboxylate reductase
LDPKKAMTNLLISLIETRAQPELFAPFDEVEKLLSTLGRVAKVDENRMDAITAPSGCAPAYLSVILDAMVYAGLKAGLPEDLAREASAQSMVGTGRIILESRKTLSEIKDMVTTPGGVTEDGLRELDKVPVRHTVMSAVKVGKAKTKRMSQILTGENREN